VETVVVCMQDLIYRVIEGLIYPSCKSWWTHFDGKFAVGSVGTNAENANVRGTGKVSGLLVVFLASLLHACGDLSPWSRLYE